MAVTLADIARKLNISKMTVSRAINNDPRVKAEVRRRVLELARRLKYRPNQFARALVTNRSYLIGIVVPDIMNLYFAEVARAIESVVRPAGFQLLIYSRTEDPGRDCEGAASGKRSVSAQRPAVSGQQRLALSAQRSAVS
ncbi:MAG: LacI family DNA-binding transcriptional regulator [Acidobacteriota bacterium]